MSLVMLGKIFGVQRTHNLLEHVAQNHRYFSYQAEGLLQLRRMVLETAGCDDWEEGIKDKPRTNRMQAPTASDADVRS